MNIVSIYFIIFLFVTVGLYWVCPKGYKNVWLLICSCFFYLTYSVEYICIIVAEIVLTYLFGRLLGRNKSRLLALISIISITSILIILKYRDFFINNVQSIIGSKTEFVSLSLIAPMGISFYTLQAISYLLDVYRGKITAEKSVVEFSLFMVFFGYILSGPIERAGNILPQLKREKKFNYKSLCHGFQTILWGYFIKLILAERFSAVANCVYGDYTYYSGFELLLGTVAYSFQLYCDFLGYSTIVVGIGETLGLNIMQNFAQPYFSTSIVEFWRRWHISLSLWLRDYVYITGGGNRKGKLRQYINILMVFIISGFWHGAGWNFVLWGLIHGICQILEKASRHYLSKIEEKLSVNTMNFSYKLGRIFCTFFVVNFAWIFFRTTNIHDAIEIIKRIFFGFDLSSSFGFRKGATLPYRFVIGKNLITSVDQLYLNLGLNINNILILLLSCLIFIIVELAHYKGISCRKWIDKQGLFFRWLIYLSLLFGVLTFGIYGNAYNSSSFIYANF